MGNQNDPSIESDLLSYKDRYCKCTFKKDVWYNFFIFPKTLLQCAQEP